MRPHHALALALVALLAAPAAAQDGHVQIPIDAYQRLLGNLDEGPPAYTLGATLVRVTTDEAAGVAHVEATIDAEVPEAEWTLIPVLPPGTSPEWVRVGGRDVRLVSTSAGPAWATRTAGSHSITLRYDAPIASSPGGRSVSLPLPPGATSRVTATMPPDALAAALIPSVSSSTSGNTLTATVPPGSGAQLAWRTTDDGSGASVSRAVYRGELTGDAVTWRAEFDVDTSSDEPAVVPLLPSSIALIGLTVDGADAAIAVADGSFAVTVRGRGDHRVVATFQSRVDTSSGQPRVDVTVPRVPVSRFELTLPGQKEVQVEPVASVDNRVADASTTAVVHVPMTERVTLRWTEAVPETAAEEEIRANAQLYHTAHAEEGVLYVSAMAVFDVTRGETSQFELTVPNGAQVNQVSSPNGMVADWRVINEAHARVLTVFLDQRVSGEFRVDVLYERLLDTSAETPEDVAVPLLAAEDVSRQRGMVALLASRELTLNPQADSGMTRVGENQLPPFVRDAVSMTIAHTYRYSETSATVTVRAQAPERQQGRFDARVDTLVSLDDVTTRAAATIELDVKSGSIMELELTLPTGVNFLSLSAPSLRDWEIEEADGQQVIGVEFTQEMEGQFRIEVAYERIDTGGGDIAVPLVAVREAEVEQGRIAIEALTAVEVQPASVENLSSVDTGELPQQLVLRTTNPILLAFKYVQATPRPGLALTVTRHREVEVQSAVIDSAHYRTLVTRDGFTVTTARFVVRNSREQFLRVTLPEGSEVWSAAVQGEPDTPALASTDEGAPPEVLINIINSAQGFPVELIYATPAPRLGFLGRVSGELPVPDMIVTETQWDLYLPDDLHYGTPDTDMDVVVADRWVDEEAMREASASGASDALRIRVPAAGRLFTFEKLYANQSGRPSTMSMPYWSAQGASIGKAVGYSGVVLLWLGLLLAFRRRERRATGIAMAVAGLVLAAGTIFYLGADPRPSVRLGLVLIGGTVAVIVGRRVWQSVREKLEAWGMVDDDDEDERHDDAAGDLAPSEAVEDDSPVVGPTVPGEGDEDEDGSDEEDEDDGRV